jgi:hypothetical protein
MVMKLDRRAVGVALVAACGVAAGLAAQPSGSMARPHHNGSVWDVGYIRVKPGMDEAYMAYLAGPWKAQHEALKKEGLILSYKVIESESHGANDFNLMLMTEYKDLATMEASEDKADALMQKVMGDDQAQMKGYKDRSEIREVVGNRLSREVILEPKMK